MHCTRAWLGDLTKAPVCRSGDNGVRGVSFELHRGSGVCCSHVAPIELDRARLVGLHDARPGPHRRSRAGSRRTTSNSLSRPGSASMFYDTLEEFYLAEALEYIDAWRQSHGGQSRSASAGRSARPNSCRSSRAWSTRSASTCTSAHFWGMDEWVERRHGKCRSRIRFHFERADRELCFNRIRPELRMPDAQPALSRRPTRRATAQLGRRRAMRRDAGRAGRRQALGVQRSAADARADTRTRRRRPPNIASWRRASSICIR